MLGRSHVTLAGASYLALLVHPLPTPWGALAAPLLRPAAGEGSLGHDERALALSVAIVALAALAPDVDHGGSAMARSLGALSRAVAGIVERWGHHRGPLHSLLAVLVAGALAELLGSRLDLSELGRLVGYGWATHVLADALTARGVPLLWPLWRQRLRLPYKLAPPSGGRVEALAVLGTVLACVWWGALGLAA